jgi:large subunit ribosomal protein L3
MIGIIGKKLGMTQLFNEQGQQIPCTVVEATPNPVTKVMAESGFASVELGMARSAPRARTRRVSGRRRASREQGGSRARAKAGLEQPPAFCELPAGRRAGQGPSPHVQRWAT